MKPLFGKLGGGLGAGGWGLGAGAGGWGWGLGAGGVGAGGWGLGAGGAGAGAGAGGWGWLVGLGLIEPAKQGWGPKLWRWDDWSEVGAGLRRAGEGALTSFSEVGFCDWGLI